MSPITRGAIIRLPTTTLIGDLEKLLAHPDNVSFDWPRLRLTLTLGHRLLIKETADLWGSHHFVSYDASTLCAWHCFTWQQPKQSRITEALLIDFLRKQVSLRMSTGDSCQTRSRYRL